MSSATHNNDQITFTCSTSAGAILALPKGARREDLLANGKFQQQVLKHGVNWERYARLMRHRTFRNGTLCLVTGSDKAKCWAMASFTDVSTRFQLALTEEPSENTIVSYSWHPNPGTVRWGSGNVTSGNDLVENQAVFIRAFWISIRPSKFGGFGSPSASISLAERSSKNNAGPFSTFGGPSKSSSSNSGRLFGRGSTTNMDQIESSSTYLEVEHEESMPEPEV